MLALLFLPQILHATTAKPPSRIAPPTPPTTPPMIFLEFEESPGLAPPSLPSWRPGIEEEDADAAATIVRCVLTVLIVLLPLTKTIVVDTCWVMLPVFLAAGLDVIDEILSVPEVRGMLEPWRAVAVDGFDDSIT